MVRDNLCLFLEFSVLHCIASAEMCSLHRESKAGYEQMVEEPVGASLSHAKPYAEQRSNCQAFLAAPNLVSDTPGIPSEGFFLVLLLESTGGFLDFRRMDQAFKL